MSPRLFLFDLDGTLVDSAADIAAALEAAMTELGQPPGATPSAAAAVAAHDPLDTQLLTECFRAHYGAAIAVRTRAYPGVVAMLEGLAAAGIPLAVITNKPGDLARALLRGLALDQFFGDVIGDGDGFPRKPSPEAAAWLLTRHAASPRQVLMVGDSLPDVHLARAVGCAVAVVTWGYTPRERLLAECPDWVVSAPEQLLALGVRSSW